MAKKGVEPKGETATAESVVFIGKKPIMSYVTAFITFFNRAVDAVELLRRAFIKDLEIKRIDISTEELARADGQKSNVSTMEITVAKSGSKQPQ